MGSEWAAHKEGFVGNETRFPVGAPPVTSPFLLHANGSAGVQAEGGQAWGNSQLEME